MLDLVVKDAHPDGGLVRGQHGSRAFHRDGLLHGAYRQLEIRTGRLQQGNIHVEAHHADEAVLADSDLVEPALQGTDDVIAVRAGLRNAAKAGLLVDDGDGCAGDDGIGGIENAAQDVRGVLRAHGCTDG